MASQRVIASLAGVAQPTVGTWAKIAGLNTKNPSDLLHLMCIVELTYCNMTGNDAAAIIAQAQHEIRYVTGGADREAYLILFRTQVSKALLAQPVLSLRAVEALLESTPVAQVVALHHVVARAAARLAGIQEKAVA